MIREIAGEARRRDVLRMAAIGMAGAAWQPGLFAAEPDWPTRQITYVVPYPPGGVGDFISRAVATPLAAALQQPVVIDNRPGASGIAGTQMVARARPDGYTLVAGAINTHVLNGLVYRSLPYDMVKDFQPVALLGMLTNVLIVRSDSPYRSVADIVAKLRAEPDALTYGSSGKGTLQHLAGEMLQKLSATQMRHIPYKGGSGAVTDLIGGSIDMIFDNEVVALPMVKAGRVRALAVTSRQPLPSLPGVPPISSTPLPGFDTFEMQPWHATYAPAGTPKPVVDRISAAIAAILAEPATRQRLQANGVEPRYLGPAALAAFQENEIAKWQGVLRDYPRE